jgi:hypothetical protein
VANSATTENGQDTEYHKGCSGYLGHHKSPDFLAPIHECCAGPSAPHQINHVTIGAARELGRTRLHPVAAASGMENTTTVIVATVRPIATKRLWKQRPAAALPGNSAATMRNALPAELLEPLSLSIRCLPNWFDWYNR